MVCDCISCISFLINFVFLCFQYSLIHKKEAAHDEGIWSCSWTRCKDDSYGFSLKYLVHCMIWIGACPFADDLLYFAFSQVESEYIVTGGIDESVKVWAWRNEQLELRHRLEGHTLGVVSVDTSADGQCEFFFLLRNFAAIHICNLLCL